MAGVAILIGTSRTYPGQDGGGNQWIGTVVAVCTFQTLVNQMFGHHVITVTIGTTVRRRDRQTGVIVVGRMIIRMTGFTTDISTGDTKIDGCGYRRNGPAVTGITGEFKVKIIFIRIYMNFPQIVTVTTATIKRHRCPVVFNMACTQINFIMNPNSLVFSLMTESAIDRFQDAAAVAATNNTPDNILVSAEMAVIAKSAVRIYRIRNR